MYPENSKSGRIQNFFINGFLGAGSHNKGLPCCEACRNHRIMCQSALTGTKHRDCEHLKVPKNGIWILFKLTLKLKNKNMNPCYWCYYTTTSIPFFTGERHLLGYYLLDRICVVKYSIIKLETRESVNLYNICSMIWTVWKITYEVQYI